MMLGNKPVQWTSLAHIGETAVDYQHTFSFLYKNGALAICKQSIESLCMNQAICTCEKGYFVVQDIAKFEKLSIYSDNHVLIEEYELPQEKTGYEYEIEAWIAEIESNKGEFSLFPHQETLYVMEMIDKIKKDWER